MVMDTITDYWSDDRPASGAGRRAPASGRETDFRWIRDDRGVGSDPVAVPRRGQAQRAGRRGPVVCTDSHAPDLHGSRLTPRGRLVVAVVWLVMAAVAGLMLAAVPGEDSQPPTVTTKVMVEPGETLWQLAGQVESGTDRHETVATIMSLNGLDSASQIRPGDILLVPVQP